MRIVFKGTCKTCGNIENITINLPESNCLFSEPIDESVDESNVQKTIHSCQYCHKKLSEQSFEQLFLFAEKIYGVFPFLDGFSCSAIEIKLTQNDSEMRKRRLFEPEYLQSDDLDM